MKNSFYILIGADDNKEILIFCSTKLTIN